MKIEYLCEHPEFLDIVSQWMHTAFCVEDRPKVTLFDMYKKLSTRDSDKFPHTYVAIIGSECVGTVTLYENDLQGEALTPWLGSLYVHPDWRGKGIGQLLIEYIKRIARDLGYDTIYLRTEHTASYYEMLGWSFLKETIDPAYQLRTLVYYTGLRNDPVIEKE